MIPIKYQVTGEEEYSFRLKIDRSGNFTVHTGTYTTQKPHAGKLSSHQEAELMSSIERLGALEEHPMPVGGSAFQAELVMGEGGSQVVYSFWEGALEEDPRLKSLVRLLEVL